MKCVIWVLIPRSIFISILTWLPRKKLKSPPRSAIWRDFQNQEYRFTISSFAFFVVCTCVQYFFDVVRNQTLNGKYLLDFTQRRSSVHEKDISGKHALKFGQWTTFSENYKLIRVWLWLAYKITKNISCSQLFSKFFQTRKRYPISLLKISILTRKLLVISSQNSSCELNSWRTYSLLCRRDFWIQKQIETSQPQMKFAGSTTYLVPYLPHNLKKGEVERINLNVAFWYWKEIRIFLI